MAKPLWMSGSSGQGVSFVSEEKFAGGGVLQSFFTLRTDVQRKETASFLSVDLPESAGDGNTCPQRHGFECDQVERRNKQAQSCRTDKSWSGGGGREGGWRDGSAVKSIDCSSRSPEFNSQHPHGSHQLTVTPRCDIPTQIYIQEKDQCK